MSPRLPAPGRVGRSAAPALAGDFPGRAPPSAPGLARRRAVLAAGLAALAGLGGCPAELYRQDADRAAYRIIAQKQVEALGQTQPFTIETPAQTLRRRLMLEQHLPYATPASLSTHDLEPIRQWPDAEYLERSSAADPLMESFPAGEPIVLTLTDALQIAAHESREYQSEKEAVFRAALALDLERDAFRRTWSSVLTGLFQSQLEQEVVLDDQGHTDRQPVSGLEYGGTPGLRQQFPNGLTVDAALGVDLVSLLTQDRQFSRGIFADGSISLPLLRGAGQFVVTEPLTQAEREVVYALYDFEQFKRTFAVDIASEYLAVLQQYDQVRNAEENYRSLIASTRRARRLAEAGRLPEIQVDQARQDELRARQRWVAAQEALGRRLDTFKLTLGLAADAELALDRGELEALAEYSQRAFPAEGHVPPPATAPAEPAGGPPGPASAPTTASAPATAPTSAPGAREPVELVPSGRGQGGPYELPVAPAVRVALAQRPDLRVAVGRIHDAQRTVAVAADQLRADLTLLGTGAAGARRTLASVSQDDAILRPDEGLYAALLTLDPPLERTAERNTYRSSLIGLEQAVRAAQQLEDQIKLAVRNRLSELREARESIQIQAASVAVALRRVASTNLFLEAGRAEIRDVLEANDALLSAQNALTSGLVDYRLAELALQRDLGVLAVNAQGLWQEYTPDGAGAVEPPEAAAPAPGGE